MITKTTQELRIILTILNTQKANLSCDLLSFVLKGIEAELIERTTGSTDRLGHLERQLSDSKNEIARLKREVLDESETADRLNFKLRQLENEINASKPKPSESNQP